MPTPLIGADMASLSQFDGIVFPNAGPVCDPNMYSAPVLCLGLPEDAVDWQRLSTILES